MSLMFEVVRLPDYELYDEDQLLELWALDPLQILIDKEGEYDEAESEIYWNIVGNQ